MFLIDAFYRLLSLISQNRIIILYVSVAIAFFLVIYIAWNKFELLLPDKTPPSDLDFQLDNFRNEINYLKRGQDSVNHKIHSINSKLKQSHSNSLPFHRATVENAAILHLVGGNIVDHISVTEVEEIHSPVAASPELLSSETDDVNSIKSENLCLKGIENKKCIEQLVNEEEEAKQDSVPRKVFSLKQK